MNIKLSQQVSATFARNHFKEVTEKALSEGICIIMRKSKPVTVVLPVEEYQKMQKKTENQYAIKPAKKITLKQLRKNSVFGKYIGCMENAHRKLTSIEIAKKWTDYVD